MKLININGRIINIETGQTIAKLHDASGDNKLGNWQVFIGDYISRSKKDEGGDFKEAYRAYKYLLSQCSVSFTKEASTVCMNCSADNDNHWCEAS